MTASATCVDRLRDEILSGTFPSGSKLPGERELCALLGVSRITLRSALAHLAAERLVDVQPQRGAVVTDFRQTGGPDLIASWIGLARTHDAEVAIGDLLEVRRTLARVVMARVHDHITTDGIARVREAVERFAVVVGKRSDTAALARADLDITRVLLREALSPVLQLCMNPIAAVLEGLPMLRDAMYANPSSNLDGWRVIVQLLEQRIDAAPIVVEALAERDVETIRRVRQAQLALPIQPAQPEEHEPPSDAPPKRSKGRRRT